ARPILQDFIVDNRAFHQSIVGLSGNPMMSALIDKYQLPVLMVQLRQVISTEQVISKALDEHEAIAEAILSGQPDAASQAMRYHLWRSTKQILSLADVTLQPSPAVMDEMADLLSLKND
ncbi:MAG: FCD domain-containing protein, partial [Alcaligenaceae bacterium]